MTATDDSTDKTTTEQTPLQKILKNKKYYYLWLLPILFAIRYCWNKVIIFTDPTAGTMSFGIFETPIAAIIYVTLFLWFALMLVNFSFRFLFDFYINDIRNTFNSLSSWQKIVSFLVVVLFLFWALNFQSGKITGSVDALLAQPELKLPSGN